MAADEFLLEKAQLQEEQFFEFQAPGGLLQRILVGREVDVANGVLQPAEGVFAEYIIRQGFADFGQTKG